MSDEEMQGEESGENNAYKESESSDSRKKFIDCMKISNLIVGYCLICFLLMIRVTLVAVGVIRIMVITLNVFVIILSVYTA